MTMSAGKLWGMRRLADSTGFWKMVAIDQRTPLFGPIAKARGVAEAPYEDVARMKALLARHLAPKGSALLVDPNYGYSAAVPEIPARCGLMLSLEHHVTEETPGGRKSRDIPDWSVAKIRQIGGDAVKLLIWHRADSAPEVRAHQLAYAEAVGRACKAHDVVYLLEVLVYPLPGEDPVVSPETRAARVLAAAADFADPKFGVDIYKMEPPTQLAGVPDPDGKEAAAAQALYDKLGALLPRPWVLLSAGASAEDFRRALVYGYRAGASGYLCGRAIWHNAFAAFPDFDRIEALLKTESVAYIDRINALTEQSALPWHRHASFQGMPTPIPTGPGFAAAYPLA